VNSALATWPSHLQVGLVEFIHREAQLHERYASWLAEIVAGADELLAGFTIIAQRLSDDGHRGFVLAPGLGSEPDWTGLEIAARQFLTSVRATQAGERGK
jgi:hypothetical protein